MPDPLPFSPTITVLTLGRMWEFAFSDALVLTIVAGGMLALLIAPLQSEALASPDHGRRLKTLGMTTGMFNLLWVIVVDLMVVRPGSSYL